MLFTYFLLGGCRRLSLARLLNRSGFRFFTFFAILVHSHFASFRLPRTSAYIHQSRLTTPHTRALFRHIEPVEMHLSFPFHRAKKCAKPSCFQQRSFPCFLILRHHSILPPSLNSQSARAHRQYFASIFRFSAY